MRVARYRALTQDQKDFSRRLHKLVEMRVARYRALTQGIGGSVKPHPQA